MALLSSRRLGLAALLDPSFTSFLTPHLVRWLYAGSLAGLWLVALVLITAAFVESVAAGLGTAIVTLVITLLTTVWIRVVLEIAVVFFQIAERTAEIAEHQAVIAVNTTPS